MTTEPEEDAVELPRRSHSQLSEYSECSERYRLKRVIRPRPPDKPAAWLTMGLAVHEALELWEKSNRTIDLVEKYYEAFDRILSEQLEKQPDYSMWMKPFRTRSVEIHLANERVKGAAQLVTFLEWAEAVGWEVTTDNESKPMVEIDLDFELCGIRIVGFVDMVHAHPDLDDVVTDAKSGNKVKSNLQLGIYKIGLDKQHGIKVEKGQFLYTKDMTLSDPVDLSRYDEKYIGDLFTALERGIQQEVYIPNPGDHCGLCPVVDFCREKGTRPVPLDWESVTDPWWGQQGVEH